MNQTIVSSWAMSADVSIPSLKNEMVPISPRLPILDLIHKVPPDLGIFAFSYTETVMGILQWEMTYHKSEKRIQS